MCLGFFALDEQDKYQEYNLGISFVVLPDQGSQAERGIPQDGLSQDQIPPIPLQSS